MIKRILIAAVLTVGGIIGAFAARNFQQTQPADTLELSLISDETTYLLEGKLAGKYGVTMDLVVIGDSISGSYYYSRPSDKLQLLGYVDGRALKFYETVTKDGVVDTTGHFAIDRNFDGKWSSGERELTVELAPRSSEVRGYRVQKYGYDGEIPFPNEPESGTSVVFDIELFELLGTSKAVRKINIELEEQFSGAVSGARIMYDENLESIEEYGYGPFGISDELIYSVDYIDDRVISISSGGYFFGGGAHGVTHVDNQIFDLSSGEQIPLDNILKNRDDRRLIALLRQKLLEEREGEDSYFDFDDIRLNDNFSISQGGLWFIYEPYEIAPYVMGMPTVFFSWGELKPFFREDSPLWYMVEGVEAIEPPLPIVPGVEIIEDEELSALICDGLFEALKYERLTDSNYSDILIALPQETTTEIKLSDEAIFSENITTKGGKAYIDGEVADGRCVIVHLPTFDFSGDGSEGSYEVYEYSDGVANPLSLEYSYSVNSEGNHRLIGAKQQVSEREGRSTYTIINRYNHEGYVVEMYAIKDGKNYKSRYVADSYSGAVRELINYDSNSYRSLEALYDDSGRLSYISTSIYTVPYSRWADFYENGEPADDETYYRDMRKEDWVRQRRLSNSYRPWGVFYGLVMRNHYLCDPEDYNYATPQRLLERQIYLSDEDDFVEEPYVSEDIAIRLFIDEIEYKHHYRDGEPNYLQVNTYRLGVPVSEEYYSLLANYHEHGELEPTYFKLFDTEGRHYRTATLNYMEDRFDYEYVPYCDDNLSMRIASEEEVQRALSAPSLNEEWVVDESIYSNSDSLFTLRLGSRVVGLEQDVYEYETDSGEQVYGYSVNYRGYSSVIGGHIILTSDGMNFILRDEPYTAQLFSYLSVVNRMNGLSLAEAFDGYSLNILHISERGSAHVGSVYNLSVDSDSAKWIGDNELLIKLYDSEQYYIITVLEDPENEFEDNSISIDDINYL